ncbi:MAG: Ig-like domain-containing protein [Clostridiales bacterium]|nr:Ig-like domain-containing protein [Clostridiales bacterium]
MKIIKFLLVLLFSFLMMATISNATDGVTVKMEFVGLDATMNFEFSGLTLNKDNKKYEWGFTELKNDEITEWYDLADFTNNKANVIIDPKIDSIANIVNKSDRGFVTIREKGSNIVMEPREVDLRIPLLELTDKPIINNGDKFSADREKCISLKLNDTFNLSYQFEKVTDSNVINKYRELKNISANREDIVNSLEKIIKKTPSSSGWIDWNYQNGAYYHRDGRYGYPIGEIKVNDDGLYYMWIKAYKSGLKTIYGVSLIDNLNTNVPLEGISLSSNYDIRVGDERKLDLEYKPTQASNREVTWESEDKSIATVDSEGRVKGIKAGSTKITAISKDGNKRATTVVNVTEKGNIYAGSSENGKVVNDSVNNKQNVNNTNQRGANNKETIISANDKDNTTAKGRLPQTGESLIVISSLLVIGLATIFGIRIYNKNFRGI